MTTRKKAMQTDVLVVGAGPVGVVLARLLGQHGIRTLLIDREPDVMRIPRAIALDDDGGRVLQAVGDYAAVRHHMPRIERVRMISPSVGDVFFYDANCWRNGNPMVLMFRQPELEDTLRAGLAQCPSVAFRTGVVLESFREKDDGVSAAIKATDGTIETVHAKFIVGCDGARSTVRKHIGIDMVGSTYERDWLVVDVRHDPTPNREVHFLCDPARPGVTMPAPNGGRRWEFMLGPRDVREDMIKPEVLATLLAPWGKVDNMEIERAAIYTFHARVAKNMQRGRIFLAGDAAHLTPPFAGQGLMAGLRDAQNLAWKLAAVLNDHADASLLASYEEERLPNARTMVNLARLMGEVIMSRGTLRCAFRDQVLRRVARLAPIRSRTSSVEIKPRTKISRGFLARGSGGHAMRGHLLPQGTVAIRDENGQQRRLPLDEHIGYRWALIGIGVDPLHFLRRDQQPEWAQLGAGLRIDALTMTTSTATSSTADTCCDIDGALTSVFHTGTCLIARPDRHLYAVVPARDLEKTMDALHAELHGNCFAPTEVRHAAAR